MSYQFAAKLEAELRAVPWDVVVIDLVLSATGGEGTKGARGGSDGIARKIAVAGSIIMASIRPPDMEAQHLGRFTLVEMQAPKNGADHTAEHREFAEWAKEIGPKLWGRALAGWQRYSAARVIDHNVQPMLLLLCAKNYAHDNDTEFLAGIRVLALHQ